MDQRGTGFATTISLRIEGRIFLPGSALKRLGVLAHAFSLLVAAAGCYESAKEEMDGRDALDAPTESTDQASDVLYLDCPAPEDVRVTISVRGTEEDGFTATGVATAVTKEADAILVVAIDLAASGQEPTETVIRLPVQEGVDIDLHPGEEVEVEYSTDNYGVGLWAELRISRNEEPIVLAGSSRLDVIQHSLAMPSLSFTLVSGRCEPQLDDFGCAYYERLGYSISCESGNEEVEVFDHGYAYMPCGPGYHVILGDLEKIVERLEPPCMDIPISRAQVIIIKHGDGLGDSGP